MPVPYRFCSQKGLKSRVFSQHRPAKFDIGNHAVIPLPRDGVIERTVSVVSDESVADGQIPAIVLEEPTCRIKGINFSIWCNEVISSAQLQKSAKKQHVVWCGLMRQSDTRQKVELMQMRGLPEFSCLEVGLQLGFSKLLSVPKSYGKRLNGGKTNVEVISCKLIFDYKIIRVERNVLEDVIANGNVRQNTKRVITFRMRVSEKDIRIKTLRYFCS